VKTVFLNVHRSDGFGIVI